jgi:hypothetical protein
MKDFGLEVLTQDDESKGTVLITTVRQTVICTHIWTKRVGRSQEKGRDISDEEKHNSSK